MASLGITKIPVGTLGTLVLRIIEDVENSKVQAVIESKEFTKLKELSAKFQASIDKKKNSELTILVDQKDAERDYLLKGFRRHLAAEKNGPIPELVKVAESATIILERFGTGIERLAYAEESQKIKSILEEFKRAENADIVKSLNLAIYLEKLGKANQEFEEVFSQRSKDETAIDEIESATQIRKELNSALNDVADLIAFTARFKTTDESQALQVALLKKIDDVLK